MTLDIVKSKIRSVQDWPKAGIVFYDITPVLEDAQCFQFLVDLLAEKCQGLEIDKVIGIDARGFLLASALAYKLGVGLAIVRKKGKLPRETVGKSYSLEYASDRIEMHKDSVRVGERVLIIDDVLATGGTMKATVEIVKELGGEIVRVLFLIELSELKGRDKLIGERVESLINF